MITEFNKNEVYEALVVPKIRELLQICNRERIPVFISACTKSDKKGTEYKSDMYAALSNDIILKDDKFTKFVNVINGFETVPSSNVMDINLADL